MRGLCYFLLSILTQVSSSTFKVIGFFGHNVTLPCSYDTQSHGVLSFCWGQEEVPMFKCSNTIFSSEDGAVVFRESPRYQLLGSVMDGDLSLTILNAQKRDAGVYGCRVEIPGWFNDYKVNVELVMEEAPEEQPATEDWILTTDATQEAMMSSTPQNVEVGGSVFDRAGAEEEFKGFLGAGNIGRMAAIFFLTIIIILVFIFRRRFPSREKRQKLKASAVDNIYESIQ